MKSRRKMSKRSRTVNKSKKSRRLKRSIRQSRGSSKTVLMIKADWCPYCRKAKPHFVRLCKEHNVKCKMIDVDQNPQEAAKYRASTIPTFVFLEKGTVVHKYNDSNPARLAKEIKAFSS